MDPTDLNALIRSITDEVLARVQALGLQGISAPAAAMARDRLLVVGTHPEAHLPTLGAHLKELTRERFAATIIAPPAVQDQFGLDTDRRHAIELLGIDGLENACMTIDSYATVVLATPLLNWAEQVLACADDRLIIRTILRALVAKVPVVAVCDALGIERGDGGFGSAQSVPFISPAAISSVRNAGQTPQSLEAAIVHRARQFAALGITLAPLASLPDLVGARAVLATERVICAAEIEELHASAASELRVAPNAIITPLARDRAQELGIRIVRPEVQELDR